MGFFSNLFSKKEKAAVELPDVDIKTIVSTIEQREKDGQIPLGKKIYDFQYGELNVRFDRDITHNWRICIFHGKERLYSFTIFAKEGEYEMLKNALKSIVEFLEGDQSIKNLPNNEILKGFYHHNG